MHEVDVLNETLTKRPGNGLRATICDKPADDLATQLDTKPFHELRDIIGGEAIGKAICGGGIGEQIFNAFKALQDPIGVVAASNWTPRLKAGKLRHGRTDLLAQGCNIVAP